MADSAAASPSATRSAPSSTEPSPRAADASSFTSNHSRPGSPRVNSIRRKPAPSSHGQESLQGLHGEGKETLAGVGDERTIAAGGGAAASSGRANSTTSASSSAGGHVPASPSSSTASHSFPPQPRPLSPTPSPNPPPAPAPLLSLAAQSTAYDYSSTTTPLGMSAYPSTAAARRPSIRSARSSVAPESVYGTQPVGVIGKHKPREVIRVERDYSGGELCQFWSGWIWELEGRVSASARSPAARSMAESGLIMLLPCTDLADRFPEHTQ